MNDQFKLREPMTNAVLIHLEKDGDHIRRVVTIECKDRDMLPALKAEAERLMLEYPLELTSAAPAS